MLCYLVQHYVLAKLFQSENRTSTSLQLGKIGGFTVFALDILTFGNHLQIDAIVLIAVV